MRPSVLQIVNVVALAVVLWANALAGAGTLSGESIGLVANRYASHFLPADWVFGIWGLIYAALGAFVVFQALPAQRDSPTVARLGYAWASNGVLNVAWVVTFSFSLFGVAWIIMVLLLVNLIWIHERIGFDRRDLSLRDRLLVAYPFGLYLAWISVALIANTFQLMTYLDWGGWGLDGPMWSAVMMVVATCLSAFMVLHRGNWWFPVVFAWAFVGIADRYADVALVANTAYGATAVGLLVMVVGLVRRRRVA